MKGGVPMTMYMFLLLGIVCAFIMWNIGELAAEIIKNKAESEYARVHMPEATSCGFSCRIVL